MGRFIGRGFGAGNFGIGLGPFGCHENAKAIHGGDDGMSIFAGKLIFAEIVLDGARKWPIALGAAVALIILVAWLYGPQLRGVSGSARWLLPALRSAALAALALSIIKPVTVKAVSTTESGAVLIIVDRSQSMSANDLLYLVSSTTRPSKAVTMPAGAAAYLVKLADGLGLLPPGARDGYLVSLGAEIDRLVQLRADLQEANNQVDFTRISGQGHDAARTRMAQASAAFKTAAVKVADQVAPLASNARAVGAVNTLRQIAKASEDPAMTDVNSAVTALTDWIGSSQAASDRAIYQANSEVRAACDQVAKTSRFQRTEIALLDQRIGLLGKINPAIPVYGYSIARDAQPLALRAGDKHLAVSANGTATDLTGALRSATGQLSSVPLQAVVLFSDGRQSIGDTTSTANFGAENVPIFCVRTAAPAALYRDCSVAKLTLPASAFVGETITARAEIQSAGMPNTPTIATLTIDGHTSTTRPVVLSANPATVEFPVKLESSGIHTVTVSIPTPLNSPTYLNKSIQRYIKVLADKMNVGVYSGSAVWDYQYVVNTLGRTPWVKLSNGVVLPTGSLSLTPEQILNLNLLILFDVPGSALSSAQWDAVKKLVSDRAASVILVAGEEHIPAEYARSEEMSVFLPYTSGMPAWRSWPGSEAGFFMVPSKSAKEIDALKLSDADSPGTDWEHLPPFFRYLSLPPLKASASALLVDRDTPGAAILTENRVGLGRTFLLGMTETWRWRFNVGERDQDRFWLQLVRYAADDPYAVHSGNLWLDADSVSLEPGQSVHLRAKILTGQSPSGDSEQTVELLSNNQTVRKITLASVGAGRYRGTLPDAPAGDFRLRLSEKDANNSVEIPLHVAENSEAEMADLRGEDSPNTRFGTAIICSSLYWHVSQRNGLFANEWEWHERDDANNFAAENGTVY
jgi:hypothetical protein